MAESPDPLDFLDLDRLLADEERAIRDTVRDWVRERVLPGIETWFEAGEFPLEVAKELGAMGLLGMHLTGYGCAGSNAVSYGLACLELEAGDSGFRSFVSVQGSLCMFPIWKFGSEEQKERWLPADGPGRGDRLLRPDRARRGLGPGAHADERPARRRRLGALGHEDVDHERQRRRPRDRLGPHRRRDPRVPRPDRDTRVLGQRRPPQALAPRERDVRARPGRGAAARPTRCCRASPG